MSTARRVTFCIRVAQVVMSKTYNRRMTKFERPAPVGQAPLPRWKGQKPKMGPTYNIAEVAAYRKARGVTQVALAAHLHKAQPYVSRLEQTRPEQYASILGSEIEEVLKAIDYVAAYRDAMIAEGVAELTAIRAARRSK